MRRLAIAATPVGTVAAGAIVYQIWCRWAGRNVQRASQAILRVLDARGAQPLNCVDIALRVKLWSPVVASTLIAMHELGLISSEHPVPAFPPLFPHIRFAITAEGRQRVRSGAPVTAASQ